MTPWLRRVALLLALSAGAVACTRAVPPEEASGTYVMNRGRAADTLVVHAGGTYVRRYAAPGRVVVTDSGRWSIDHIGRERVIGFAAFTPRWRSETFPGAAPPAVGWWPVQPERAALGGEVRLPVSDDLGWAYVRVGPAP